MLYTSILTAVLAAIPSTCAAPLSHVAVAAEPYNCGYVRTREHSSVVAGISAFGECMPFFFNQTINDYQDAFAYRLYGGCQCRFYKHQEDCVQQVEAPVYKEPTDHFPEPYFPQPKPKWYSCNTMKN